MIRKIGKRSFALFFLLLVILLSACADQPTKKTYMEDALDPTSLEAQKQHYAPDFIGQALLNGPSLQSTKQDESARRFDVSVKNIPAKTFFISLMTDAKTNIVTHPDVSGAISLDLVNVTVGEVLDVVRDVFGYEYRKSNNIYTVYPRKLRTEIFPINYIDVQRMGVTDTSVTIGDTQRSESDSSKGGSNKGNQSASSGAAGSPGSRVQTTNKTDFWEMLRKTVSTMVSAPADGRSVMVNPQSGLVVVTAMPNEIHAVRRFLEKSELSVKRQVILEAQIIEVQLSDGFEAGINWNAIEGELHYSSNVTSYSSTQVLEALNDGPEIFASIFKVFDVRDLLSLLKTQGSVQVLSSPRVSTVNNQKAVIRVGSDEYFVTGVKNNTTSNSSATTSSPELELASFFSGISLDVTPQISADGDVILHIHPIVSEVTDQIKEVTVGDSKFSLPLALRDIRESDSIVRAKSGQVIVLGGLMQKSNHDQVDKKPLLGDVPGLNALFKRKVRGERKTELVILLRPVVVNDEVWKSQIQQFRNLSSSTGEELRGR